MNWRRGLIRLWLVGLLGWIVVVGWVTWYPRQATAFNYVIDNIISYVHNTIIDRSRSKRLLDEWREQTSKNARPWKDTKTRIWASHGMQPKLSLTDLVVDLGASPNSRNADFCATEFDGLVVTEDECAELKRVAEAMPALPMPSTPETLAEVTRRIATGINILLEWSEPLLLPPVTILLISVALAWALRGFRRM